jgi:hypothetical protein
MSGSASARACWIFSGDEGDWLAHPVINAEIRRAMTPDRGRNFRDILIPLLLGAFFKQYHFHCLNYNQQIKQEALILDVVEVVPELFPAVFLVIGVGKA